MADSLKVLGTNSNNGILHTIYAKKEGRNTLIYFKETLNVSENKVGVISYFKKVNKNCSKDNWVRFTNENKEFLHVFYTGSSIDDLVGHSTSLYPIAISSFAE